MNFYQVIGVEKKTGNYQGHDYANIILHCTYSEPANLGGSITKIYKFKEKDCLDIIGSINPDSLLGKKIDVAYNEFQQVKRIDIVK